MREILFRGKDPETGKWYEGFYMALSDTTYCFKEDYAAHPDNTKHYIVFDEMTDWCLPNRHLRADVDPSTVGQYTGLKDKHGNRIFEGDIIKRFWLGAEILYCVRYDGENAHFIGKAMNKSGFTTFDGDGEMFEVIGNITDNPELLEK